MPDLPVGEAGGSLTRRLVAGATLGAIIVALVVVVLLRSTFGLSDAQQAAERSARALSQAILTEKLVVDLETGLRGFVITGERRFLAPYLKARTEAPAAAVRLRRLVADDRLQRIGADAIRADIAAYLERFAEPVLAAGRPPAGSRRAVAVVTEGKRRLDEMRAEIAGVSGREGRRLSDRSAAADRRAGRATGVGLAALLALLALVGLLAVFVDRAVVRPVKRMGQAVEQIRGGDLSVRLSPRGPAEIAALGTAIGDMAGALSESRLALEERNAELRRLGERNLALLDNVFAQSPTGLAFLDRDLRYVRVNAALAAMAGVAVEAHIGRRPGEVTPQIGARGTEALMQVLTTGDPLADLEIRGTTAADPGAVHDWSIAVYPVREDGSVAGVGLVVLDVTDARRVEAERETSHAAEREARRLAEAARARAALLADAGSVLDASLDVDETLDNLVSLIVPRVADWCAIDLVAPGERIRSAAVAHSDPARLAAARDLRARYPPDPAAETGVPAVIRTGRAELYEEIPEALVRESARDETHRKLISAIGMTSAMVVPLSARGGNLGAITFVMAESGRHFDEDDFAVARILGRRAALALDNARLYRERSDVARTLQASLLPEALPEIPGVALAARYEPLGASTEVGGDFYDVFATDEGRWAVVIGDVCGKGAEAAALTALARYTLRAVAPLEPIEALRRLNAAILRQRDDLRFITIAYAELDLRPGRPPRMRLAVGGHPPPLVLPRSGPGRAVECRGTLIGVTPDPVLQQCTIELAGGDTVAFYTDGVTEASHAAPLTADDLLTRMNGHDRSAAGVADALQQLARSSHDAARDDVAILALQLD